MELPPSPKDSSIKKPKKSKESNTKMRLPKRLDSDKKPNNGNGLFQIRARKPGCTCLSRHAGERLETVDSFVAP